MGNIHFNLSQGGHLLPSFSLKKKDVSIQQIDWKIINRINIDDETYKTYYLDENIEWVILNSEADVQRMLKSLKGSSVSLNIEINPTKE